MSEKMENTILSPIEQAFVAAITWDKSDALSRTKGIIDTQNITTLSDYLNNHRALHPVSDDVINSDNNKKTYVIPIDVTRGDGSAFKLNIIVDSKGRDLAIIPLTMDGKEAEGAFQLASKLDEKLKNNKEALSKVIDAKTVDSILDVKSLDDMAEKIAKGERIVDDNPKEALERVQEKNSDVSKDISVEKNGEIEKDNKAENDEEQEFPSEYKTKIEEACEKAGIDRSMLKQVIIVKNPKSLTDSLEGENITETGGEVIILQLKSGVSKNPSILVQGNNIDKTGRFDEEISRRLNPNTKFGATVENAEVNKNDSFILELPMDDGSAIAINMDEEPINSQLSDFKKLELEEKVKIIRELWKKNIELAKTPEEKCAAYENANRALEYIENEYGIKLDKFQDGIDDEHEKVDAQEEETVKKEDSVSAEVEEKKVNVQEEKESEEETGYEGYEEHYGHNFNDEPTRK
jgi:hypothetical protein